MSQADWRRDFGENMNTFYFQYLRGEYDAQSGFRPTALGAYA